MCSALFSTDQFSGRRCTVCRGRARGYIQLDNGLYRDVIFLGGAGCQILTSHPFFFRVNNMQIKFNIPQAEQVDSRLRRLSRDFVPYFRRLETRALSDFRSRLVASLRVVSHIDGTSIILSIYTVSIKHGLRTVDFGLRVEDCRLWAADCGLRTADYGLST